MYWSRYQSIYISDVSDVHGRHEDSKGRGIRAVLYSSQNRYEHGTSCASHMPAQKTAVNCDATSLFCHVGLGMDDESWYGEILTRREWAMESSQASSRLILDLKGGPKRGPYHLLQPLLG